MAEGGEAEPDEGMEEQINDFLENMMTEESDTPQEGDAFADLDEDRKQLMVEWEETMMDFIPDDLITFDLSAKEEEIFYEKIMERTKIRGAYFVSYYTDEKIDFLIKDPRGNILLRQTNKREGLFSINASIIGD